ncbi:bifunctional ADP-dependent NAD(P)H-hydrate dehydratase/NAD(P)H-hydrate epimerase [Aeromicrobium wangtongii]|uniref:ADP-dependent (S)-NAD(P)H-hydrate dehydratase n=1 Tax=Aeromicrobium wangtongii TaxID=2969247 RepID=A0ABY5M4N2_9ACTN|nr:bifunctional ADP-dependent NAD(P)H-hydrate dehydratase/NAD(P)H-hydrate epimerase [Aeromicrobium wangtongii]MCD9198830.1 bifunctional ADP-dependent NAD(P)H-hydrate dehydratase/NAD(P)H-hydrate epimerase [Aeromicrobium wangtongii]UUP13130.1 bifunctional ADP-dependent NAD(P)H-hydrate dehydratase/NAD(P)H-hydrate epimerase [Aeromicrobium wangtongii]
MLTAHAVDDIRTAEQALAAGLPDGELMRRAARGLADALDDIPAGEVLLALIGPGNNGGDALYAAVHLLDRGVRVDLCLLDPSTVHADGLAAALAAGAQVVERPGQQRHCLDAVFGIGARPGLTGRAAEWVEWIAATGPRTVAVDVPSGVDVDGATLPSTHVTADATVTFGTYKTALLVGPAAGAAGRGAAAIPDLVDIGLAPHLPAPHIEAIEASDGHLLAEIFDWLRAPTSHKYSRGVLGIAAGSTQYAGAAHLCVAGAQAGMAGMVRFVGEAELARRVVDRAPEVVAGRGRVQAWVVGPGGGDDAAAQLAAALDDGVPVVVDASALQHVPDSFDVPALLTPHAGELAQMLGVQRETVEADPLGHVTEAARRWGVTVLLKGARTLIATPGRVTRVNLTGSPWLGTAGSGDVLAGLAGSLLASGADPHDAGSLAAFLHGAASIRANRGGPVTASAVAAALPGTVAAFHDGHLDDVRDWRS